LHWLNHLASLLGVVGLAPFVGGNLNSKVFSPAMTVYADEVIGMARHFAGGFQLDDEALGIDEIPAAGPGGSFLASPLTLKNFRRAYYQGRLFPRLSLDKWQEQSRPGADQFIRLKAQELLTSHPSPADNESILASGEEWIRSWQLNNNGSSG
jgi:trimethylamine---corrinoid protein Co-methyltransferase